MDKQHANCPLSATDFSTAPFNSSERGGKKVGTERRREGGREGGREGRREGGGRERKRKEGRKRRKEGEKKEEKEGERGRERGRGTHTSSFFLHADRLTQREEKLQYTNGLLGLQVLHEAIELSWCV